MFQRKSPPPKRKQKITSNVSVKPAQKNRTKRRKPKYLSLSLKLSPQKKNHHQQSFNNKKQKLKLKLNVFPLHPEKQVEDSSKDMHDQDNNNIIAASFLFDTATDSTTTLDGLLTASEEGPLSPPTPLVTYGKSTDESGSGECSNYGLVRTAMRCKERDASEERWVSYSEVVDSKMKMEIKEEEGSSCVEDDDDDDEEEDASWRMKQGKKKRLLLDLKLDYQEILNAWSDKGPLFVDGESPQTIPYLMDPNMLIDAWGNSGNLCSIPEMTGNLGSFKVDELGCKEGWNREHREASVLRYKEKRQNRLFAKRIRYEVRKLNAEKRPRMKGRFVKRNSEV